MNRKIVHALLSLFNQRIAVNVPSQLLRLAADLLKRLVYWNRANRYWLGSMTEALSNRLRISLREELGGTYGVSASASPGRACGA